MSPVAMAKDQDFKFLLFVAGATPNSAQALRNLNSVCQAHLPGQHSIEVVDVFLEPQRALADGIYMTPTLVKLAPGVPVRIVGTLSEIGPVLLALGLEAVLA